MHFVWKTLAGTLVLWEWEEPVLLNVVVIDATASCCCLMSSSAAPSRPASADKPGALKLCHFAVHKVLPAYDGIIERVHQRRFEAVDHDSHVPLRMKPPRVMHPRTALLAQVRGLH